ncbi:hypothetical protein [Enterobacter quasiroggenkampii]|uniref:hypothetical protein n=1 Tax=Enterobacter quasiroggenkampii TaxID=2497436 RepID=UPI0039C4BC56
MNAKELELKLSDSLHREDVLKEKIAALEARCAALAAEVQAVKASIPKLKDIEFENDNMDDVSLAEDVGFNDAVTLMNKWMPKTPATDAFLAEVRAQGVEMFADHLSGMNISASETSVREFATKLRKGVQS